MSQQLPIPDILKRSLMAAKDYMGVAIIEARPRLSSAVLRANGWSSSGDQIILVDGVQSDESKQAILPTPSLASQDAFYEADIRCTAQGNGQLTFHAAEVPKVDLSIFVLVQEVEGYNGNL